MSGNREADRLADEAARLQAAEGATERVEQMYADARAARAEGGTAPLPAWEVVTPGAGHPPEPVRRMWADNAVATVADEDLHTATTLPDAVRIVETQGSPDFAAYIRQEPDGTYTVAL